MGYGWLSQWTQLELATKKRSAPRSATVIFLLITLPVTGYLLNVRIDDVLRCHASLLSYSQNGLSQQDSEKLVQLVVDHNLSSKFS
jgi:hypothetical protein